ncbi:MAG: hypothetical protein Q8K64_13630 [Sediminibacterium sp.]|nr:hypothetical protein [Sediminibacterium sp.]
MKQFIKTVISADNIQKLARFKNYQKAGFDSIINNHLLQKSLLNIGEYSFDVNYINQIKINTWRYINDQFSNLNSNEQQKVLSKLLRMSLDTPEFYAVISNEYLSTIITNKELYLTLKGSSEYVNGKLADAFTTFSELVKIKEDVVNYHIMLYRVAIFLDNGEILGREVLENALKIHQNHYILLLCLASTYFRCFDIVTANKILNSIDKEGFDKIRKYPIAGTPFEMLGKLDAELKEAIRSKLLERPKVKSTINEVGDRYDDDFNDYYWNELYFWFLTSSKYTNAYGYLRDVIIECIETAILKQGDINNVFDFGAYCAYPIYKLSQKYKEINFYGIDRDKSTKVFNERAFKSANISFKAEHILDTVTANHFEGNSLIFHSRTATLIYPQKLKDIYKTFAEKGIKYIALYENSAISRTEMQYFNYSDLPSDAIPYGSQMIIHNYHLYLKEAGYEVIFEKRYAYADLDWTGQEELLGDSHTFLLAKLVK